MPNDDTVKDDVETVTTPPDPAPEHTPPPAPEPEETKDTLHETVHNLVSEVADLKSIVANLTDTGNDSVPVKQPWTHRKWF